MNTFEPMVYGRRPAVPTSQWWSAQRPRYNRIVITCTVATFICHGILFMTFMDRIPGAEVTLFTIIPDAIISGILFVCWIGLVNLWYLIGPITETLVPRGYREAYRTIAWQALTAFTAGLPAALAVLSLARAIHGE